MADTKPAQIKVDKSKQTLSLVYENNEEMNFSAEMLRVFSPSAEVQGHSPEQKKLISGKSTVRIQNILPVGNYAIRIIFDDSHDTGIFSWDYFHELNASKDVKWQEYLDELKQNNKTREF